MSDVIKPMHGFHSVELPPQSPCVELDIPGEPNTDDETATVTVKLQIMHSRGWWDYESGQHKIEEYRGHCLLESFAVYRDELPAVQDTLEALCGMIHQSDRMDMRIHNTPARLELLWKVQ